LTQHCTSLSSNSTATQHDADCFSNSHFQHWLKTITSSQASCRPPPTTTLLLLPTVSRVLPTAAATAAAAAAKHSLLLAVEICRAPLSSVDHKTARGTTGWLVEEEEEEEKKRRRRLQLLLSQPLKRSLI
jgi:hypothetical protein